MIKGHPGWQHHHHPWYWWVIIITHFQVNCSNMFVYQNHACWTYGRAQCSSHCSTQDVPICQTDWLCARLDGCRSRPSSLQVKSSVSRTFSRLFVIFSYFLNSKGFLLLLLYLRSLGCFYHVLVREKMPHSITWFINIDEGVFCVFSGKATSLIVPL